MNQLFRSLYNPFIMDKLSLMDINGEPTERATTTTTEKRDKSKN